MESAATEHGLAYALCVQRFGPPDGPATLPELEGAEGVIERFWKVAARLGFAPGGPVITGTRSEVGQQLARVADRSSPSRRTLLYWLGHGVDLDIGVMLPLADWDPDRPEETSVGSEVLHLWARRFQGDVLTVLDACGSGDLARRLDDRLRDARQYKSRPVGSVGYLGTAAREERAREGVWLGALETVVGDRGAQTRHGALWTPYTAALSASELLEAVRDRLPETIRQEPRLYGGEGLNRFFRNPYHDPQASARSAALRGAAAELRSSKVPHLRLTAEDERFVGRSGPLRRAADWLAAPGPERLLLVTGKPGCGKSAFLAQLVRLTLETDGGEVHRSAAIPPGHRAPVAAVALCRDAGALDVARQLAGSMELPPPDGGWRDVAQVLAAIEREAGRRAATAFVVDGLDEAAQGHLEAVVEEVLTPLAALPGAQLVIGSRSLTREARFPLLETARVEDLDRDADRDEDIAAYVRGRLAAPGSPYAGPAGDEEPPPGVVAAVTARSQGSFLAALLYSALLARLDKPFGRDTREFRAVLDAGLDDVFDQELSDLDTAARKDRRRTVDRPGWSRGLLLPLALAQGAGLPLEDRIWQAAANALAEEADTGHHYEEEDIRRLVDRGSAHIDIAGESGQQVYRLYHKAWVGHLTGAVADPRRAHAALTDVLLTVHRTRYAGRDATNPYIARHLAEHAAAAGRLDEILRRADLLVRLDPERLSMLLDRPELPITPASALYRRIADALGRAPDPLRRTALLAATALRDDAGLLDWARTGAPLPWQDLWTTAGALGHTREWRAPRGDVLALAGTAVPEPALLGAGEQLWRWPLAGGEPELLRGTVGVEPGRAANRLRALAVPERPEASVAAVAGDAGRVLVWPRDTGEVRVLNWGAGIAGVAVGGDADLEVVAAAGGTHLGLWAWTDGRLRHLGFRRWRRGAGTVAGVAEAVAVIRLGDALCLVAGGDGGCVVIDVRTGRETHAFGAEGGSCRALAAVEHAGAGGAGRIPPGTYVAGLFTVPPDIRVWRLDGTEAEEVLGARRREPSGSAITLGHQGADLLLATLDGDAARIWNLSAGRELLKRPGHRSSPTSLAFLPDRSGSLAVADGVRIRVWDPPAAGRAPAPGDGLLSPSAKLFGALASGPVPGSGAVALASGGRVRAWDLTGRRVYEQDDLVVTGAVALHTDRTGRTWLAVTDRDRRARARALVRALDEPDAPWRVFGTGDEHRRDALFPAVAFAEDEHGLRVLFADGRRIRCRNLSGRARHEAYGGHDAYGDQGGHAGDHDAYGDQGGHAGDHGAYDGRDVCGGHAGDGGQDEYRVPNGRIGQLAVARDPAGRDLLAATAGDSLWIWPGPRYDVTPVPRRFRLPPGAAARALAVTFDGAGRGWFAVAAERPVDAPADRGPAAVHRQETESALFLGRPDGPEGPDGLRRLHGAPPRINSLAFATAGTGEALLLAASREADLPGISGWTVAGPGRPARWEIPSRGYDVQSVLAAPSPAGGLFLAAVGLDRMDLLHLDRPSEAVNDA
ncbi:AAA family ATPase [Streptomyces sp. NPDC051211]|uniref:AAA family ATPase n=1 Tax=Streptomyces sp. NPDC051211 TaxID=3154643 RepID=UPI00344C786E